MASLKRRWLLFSVHETKVLWTFGEVIFIGQSYSESLIFSNLTVYQLTLALAMSSSPIIGSNVSTPQILDSVSTAERFYLNTARPAPCNGTITSLEYCYYGEMTNSRRTYQSIVALYRPVGGTSYQRISDTISISKQTPIREIPSADVLLPGFNCDSYELNSSIQVQMGDVIGACIYDTLNTEQLDLVSLTGDGLILPFKGDSDAGCEDDILPDTVDGLRDDDSRRIILHVFAEISKSSIVARNKVFIYQY